MKPRKPVLPSVRLTDQADQVRERIRYLHYSLSIEKVYLYWERFFHSLDLEWAAASTQNVHARVGGAFLSMLATERNASASPHN